jgi:hypothetical protein
VSCCQPTQSLDDRGRVATLLLARYAAELAPASQISIDYLTVAEIVEDSSVNFFESERGIRCYDLLWPTSATEVFVQRGFYTDPMTLNADVVGAEEVKVLFQLHASHTV